MLAFAHTECFCQRRRTPNEFAVFCAFEVMRPNQCGDAVRQNSSARFQADLDLDVIESHLLQDPIPIAARRSGARAAHHGFDQPASSGSATLPLETSRGSGYKLRAPDAEIKGERAAIEGDHSEEKWAPLRSGRCLRWVPQRYRTGSECGRCREVRLGPRGARR